MTSSNGILEPFLGALQACVSVLFTLFWGLVARRMKLLKEQSIKDLSGLGVRVFLPALIVVNLGSQLHLDTALDYIPVLGRGNRTIHAVQKLLTLIYYSLVDCIHRNVHSDVSFYHQTIETTTLGHSSMCLQ